MRQMELGLTHDLMLQTFFTGASHQLAGKPRSYGPSVQNQRQSCRKPASAADIGAWLARDRLRSSREIYAPGYTLSVFRPPTPITTPHPGDGLRLLRLRPGFHR